MTRPPLELSVPRLELRARRADSQPMRRRLSPPPGGGSVRSASVSHSAPDGPRVITSGGSASRLPAGEDTCADAHFGPGTCFFTLTQTRQSSDVVALDPIASQPPLSPRRHPRHIFSRRHHAALKSGQGEVMNWASTTLCYFVILFYFLPLGCGMRKSDTTQSRAALCRRAHLFGALSLQPALPSSPG